MPGICGAATYQIYLFMYVFMLITAKAMHRENYLYSNIL